MLWHAHQTQRVSRRVRYSVARSRDCDCCTLAKAQAHGILAYFPDQEGESKMQRSHNQSSTFEQCTLVRCRMCAMGVSPEIECIGNRTD